MFTRRRALILTAAAASALPLPGAAGEVLKLRSLYQRGGGFSDLARQLDGKRITVSGFMAPPLKAEARFFVLTRRPMTVCPFCETSAEWPDDILAVLTKRKVKVTPFNRLIETSGVLELGEYRDPETGFLSLIRLSDASYG